MTDHFDKIVSNFTKEVEKLNFDLQLFEQSLKQQQTEEQHTMTYPFTPDELNYKLCYVEGETSSFALHFTSAPLDKQWGDDWDDAPYECNAGDPYDHHYSVTSDSIGSRVQASHHVIKVYADLPDVASASLWIRSAFRRGERQTSAICVRDINLRSSPWLVTWNSIGEEEVASVGSKNFFFAGETLGEFITFVRGLVTHSRVYTEMKL